MRHRIIAYLLLLGAVAGCTPDNQPASTDADVDHQSEAPDEPAVAKEPESQAAPATGDDSRLELELVTLEVPAGWTRKAAGSTFLLAEFSLPGKQGDQDAGRLTISVAGGGVDANLDRWRGQFVGDLTAEARSDSEVNGLPVTMVDFAGEFNDRRGPFAPETLRPEYRMLAAIVSVDGQLHFIKATGPRATMDHQRKAFETFVKSVARR